MSEQQQQPEKGFGPRPGHTPPDHYACPHCGVCVYCGWDNHAFAQSLALTEQTPAMPPVFSGTDKGDQ